MPGTDRTAVCFDLDGTLLSYDRPYEAIVREGLGPHLDDFTDETVERVIGTLLDNLEALDGKPYRGAAAVAVPDDDSTLDPETLLDSVQTAELAATSVSDPARDSVDALSADSDSVLCLLTDGHDDWQRAKLEHHDLAAHFAHVVTSYEAGGTKTSGEPYDLLRERVDADEYVMIGDDYAADVEAARAAGFVPIHYEDTDGPDFFATLSALL